MPASSMRQYMMTWNVHLLSSAGGGEVAVTQEIVRLALGVLSRHPLRSMDALQLAAALFVSGRTEGLEMVTFDTRLGRAARNEGLIVIM